ncbi:MAG: DUF4396 domain-containing protein [Mycobacterium sp.]
MGGLFQAFAMRDIAGGSYLVSLKMTFLPELLSMNLLMTGMVLTSGFAMMHVGGADDPARPQFWLVMSIALIVGLVCAYPINWWLVTNHMKHGMLTVRREAGSAPMARMAMGDMSEHAPKESTSPARQPSPAVKAIMTVVSFAILGGALATVVLVAM